MPNSNVFRVVTGHDENGKSIVCQSGALSTVEEIATIPNTFFHEVWKTEGAPVVIDNSADPSVGPITLHPPKKGTVIRFVDIPPDRSIDFEKNKASIQKAFSQIGNKEASTVEDNSPHLLMHRTETVDYGIVIEGEIVLVLDDTETVVPQGGVIIQRGTNHAWANKTDKTCRMLFILIDGEFSSEISAKP